MVMAVASPLLSADFALRNQPGRPPNCSGSADCSRKVFLNQSLPQRPPPLTPRNCSSPSETICSRHLEFVETRSVGVCHNNSVRG